MDWLKRKEDAAALVKKYRYVLAVLLAGVVLMCLPKGQQTAPAREPEADQTQTLARELEELLSGVRGAGRVKVLLTQAAGAETLYQSDGAPGKTVLVTGSDRTQEGLVRQVRGPVWQGAVILCQGADSARVCLELVQAVMSATGLGSDRITVLKMK